MIVVSDVHAAFEALTRVASEDQPLLILGDFVNFVDYRTGAGVAAEVFGPEFAAEVRRLRAVGDYEASRILWRKTAADRGIDLRRVVGEALDRQYSAIGPALSDARGFAIHGNVDHPDRLKDSLPPGIRYADREVIEIDGWRVGFVAGGMATPLNTPGERSDADMEAALSALGPVDVLCTHVPPAVEPLRFDTVVGRPQRASRPILDYLARAKPRYHLFGDVHQPRAHRWQVGETTCINVGYFRATGRGFELAPRA